jgi:hypothetical protein
MKQNYKILPTWEQFLIYNNYNEESHVRWVPCHHGMARPQVADGGDSLQFGG